MSAHSARTPASGPTRLTSGAWWSALKRTVKEFQEDDLGDWAAALTYYGILSLFPALIVFVAVLGVIGTAVTQPLLNNINTVAPGPAKQILQNAIKGVQDSGGGASGVLLVVGLAGALWSASGYIGAFMRAANAIWEVQEGRPTKETIPLRLGITVAMLVMLAITGIAVVFTGPLADHAGDVLGVGSQALTVWDIAKWPVLVLMVSLMLAVLYYAAPNVHQPGFRWVTPGALTAVLLWAIASGAFALYVANFGSYNKTYGSLGGVAVFLVWLWISNIAVLLGAELDAELERGRELEAGRLRPPDREPFLPPRSEPEQ
jgi:membrane protein